MRDAEADAGLAVLVRLLEGGAEAGRAQIHKLPIGLCCFDADAELQCADVLGDRDRQRNLGAAGRREDRVLDLVVVMTA